MNGNMWRMRGYKPPRKKKKNPNTYNKNLNDFIN